MSSIPPQDHYDSGEILLVDLWAVIWTERLKVFLGALAGAVVAAIIAFAMTPQFESTVLLSPVSDEEGGARFSGASALLSQFGGLSAIGGINFSSSNRKSEAIATLQSRALTQTYIQEKDLLPIFFESKWDASTGRWKSDDLKKQPTLWKGEEFFSKLRQITEDKKTGLVKLTITWKDPVLAATWANELVQRANFFLRQKSIDQSNRNIAYLNEQLTRTSVVELQKAVYSLIESEIKKVMIAQGSDEYAFKVVDPAVVPEKKVKPKRSVITIIGAVMGFAFASIIVLVRARARSSGGLHRTAS